MYSKGCLRETAGVPAVTVLFLMNKEKNFFYRGRPQKKVSSESHQLVTTNAFTSAFQHCCPEDCFTSIESTRRTGPNIQPAPHG